MKSKIKAVWLLVCAGCAVALIPVFLANDNPIEVNMPELRLEELAAQEAREQRSAQASAVKAKVRRMFRCETDEDCIIVDKDPCGCLVGPSGVTAINAAYTLDFNKMNASMVAKACPDVAPSAEKECSPDAQAVCRENVCQISY